MFRLSGVIAQVNSAGGLDLNVVGKNVSTIPPLTVYTPTKQSKCAAGDTAGVGSTQRMTAASGAKFVAGDELQTRDRPLHGGVVRH